MIILSAGKSFVKNCHHTYKHLTWNRCVELNEVPQAEALLVLEHELNKVPNLILLNTTLLGSHIETFWLADHPFFLFWMELVKLLVIYFVYTWERPIYKRFSIFLVAVPERDVTQKQVHVNRGDPAVIVKIKPIQ